MFGAKGDVRANVHYLDETTVLYAAGNQIVLHHVESNTQRFVPGAPDAEGITALALSPNRKFLAIAERGEKATISVLDLTTHAKRRKVLSSAEVNAKVRRRRDAVPGLISSLGLKNNIIHRGPSCRATLTTLTTLTTYDTN